MAEEVTVDENEKAGEKNQDSEPESSTSSDSNDALGVLSKDNA